VSTLPLHEARRWLLRKSRRATSQDTLWTRRYRDVHVRPFIASNIGSQINYGEGFCAGERISSSLAESMVNAVISKSFAKCQQVQWTAAHTCCTDPNAGAGWDIPISL
jgi:hypothetical protein